MGRENCSMCYYIGNDRCCEYFDYGYKCTNVPVCPDGLDDDEDYFEDDEE